MRASVCASDWKRESGGGGGGGGVGGYSTFGNRMVW